MPPVQVRGEVLSIRRLGAYHVLTMLAPGIAEHTRPGQFVAVAVGGGRGVEARACAGRGPERVTKVPAERARDPGRREARAAANHHPKLMRASRLVRESALLSASSMSILPSL